MPSHTLRQIVILVVALLSTSCSKRCEIRGDIFIVTRGRESVKLSLVELGAIPASEVKRIVSKRQDLMASAQPRIRQIDAEFQDLGISEEDINWPATLTKDQVSRLTALWEERKRLRQLNEPLHLSDLPFSKFLTKSDADGHFRLTLPCGDYYVVAHAERQVFGAKESYYWCVPARAVKQAEERLMLSNDNQRGDDVLEL